MIRNLGIAAASLLFLWAALIIFFPFLPQSWAGIIQAIIPAAVPTANKQGNGSLFQLSTGAVVSGNCAKFDANGNTVDSGAACTAGAVGNAVTSVTPVTVNAASVTTDQQLIELSLPAGFLNTLKQPFLINAAGLFSTPVAQTPALTFKVKLCTVSGCGSGTVVTLASIASTATLASSTNNPWNFSILAYTSATGATGNMEVHGPLAVDLGAAVTTAVSVFNDTNTAVSSNIDLTAALFVDFTAAISSLSASNTVTQRAGGIMPFAATATGGSAITIANEGATGTTVNKLAKLTGAPSTAIITATTDTAGAIGVVTSGAGITGSATITLIGAVSCVFEGATTAGHYVILGSVTAGDCKDGGAAYPTTGQVIGRVLSTNGGAGTFLIDLFPSEIKSGAAAGLTLIEEHTAAASATLPFTTCISSTYDQYQIELVNLFPATATASLRVQFSTNGGASYDGGANYQWATLRFCSTATASTGGTGDTSLLLAGSGGDSLSTSTQSGMYGTFKLFSPGNGAFRPSVNSDAGYSASACNGEVRDIVTGQYLSVTAVNAFQLLMSSGNIASGTARCYGISK